MFAKILIANRGEVAVRVIRACKEMGIASVAVYSEADRDSLPVSLADESYCIGGPAPRDSYLNRTAVLTAALVSGAQAIHPGYGFLAESADFAALCEKHGVVFIGPPSKVVSLMGDKDAARKTMREAGVPVIPGSGVLSGPAEAAQAAQEIGFPLLVKARAGGGGRGIRLVTAPGALDAAFRAASAEALAVFGDGAVYLEKYLRPVKHVEMQILADSSGSVVCLGERDCSVQRKNQKLIEETPCPVLSEEGRRAMVRAASAAARTVGYLGAGTVEFLLDAGGRFYFMEMNTRLQVEHPVTEMATGVDLVKWQIRVAAGRSLEFTQTDILPYGHAIECRVNAEDPERDFRPSGGVIGQLHVPGGPWVRFDTAVYQGYTVPPYYDSMIGKLIVHAATRDEAIRKMKAALCELILEGVPHTAQYLNDLLSHPDFEKGTYTTDFLRKGGDAP